MSTANDKMEKTEEARAVLGLDVASSPKDAEYNLVTSLLKAVDYKTSEDNCAEVVIERGGVHYFTVHLQPIGDKEMEEARRHATKYVRNPQGPRYPKIEAGMDSSLFGSWMIYLATSEKDKKEIWGNKTIMAKCGVPQPVDMVDELLLFGEKNSMLNVVFRISGLEEEELVTQEEYAKKS